MIVRADEVPPEGLRVDRPLQIGPLSYEGDLEIGVADARLTATLTPARDGLLCRGRLAATAYVPCSRCLDAYALQVGREFEVIFLGGPPDIEKEGMEIQIGREDLDDSYLDERMSLDIDRLAAEQIYLEIPMKPLCTEACRGICPSCGSNLNQETCRCAPPA